MGAKPLEAVAPLIVMGAGEDAQEQLKREIYELGHGCIEQKFGSFVSTAGRETHRLQGIQAPIVRTSIGHPGGGKPSS